MVDNAAVRRFALVLLTVGVALAATAAALAGSKDPQLHKRAADVRLAKSLILKRADLPAGFVDKGPEKNSGRDAGPPMPGAEPARPGHDGRRQQPQLRPQAPGRVRRDRELERRSSFARLRPKRLLQP